MCLSINAMERSLNDDSSQSGAVARCLRAGYVHTSSSGGTMLIGYRRGIAALGLAGLIACGNGSGPTDPDPRTGVISGAVVAEGSALADVGVGLSGAATASTSTGADGSFRFENLAAGTYQVSVSLPAGYEMATGEATRTVQLSAGGTATVEFALAEEDPDAPVVVDLRNLLFDPDNVTIQPGRTVRWVNRQNEVHNVTPQGHTEWPATTLNTTGDDFEHVFDNPGTFEYTCTLHPGMDGTIVVEN
jgi:plastocyanin